MIALLLDHGYELLAEQFNEVLPGQLILQCYMCFGKEIGNIFFSMSGEAKLWPSCDSAGLLDITSLYQYDNSYIL
jgi:hypothetical protein